MSIIIKTPQPDTEERLVLVPPESVSRSVEGVSQPGACDLAVHTNNARDATPADLARGGYVRDDDTRAGLRDALRARERAELDALAELDEQRARAEKAEGLLIQRETELRLAREDGDERARDLRQAYERAMAAAEKAERERDEAKAGHNAVQPRVYALEADLAETVHERDAFRVELARLTAPGEGSEGEPTYEALGEHYRNAWDASEAMLEMGRRHDAYAALYRLGVAHERARQQPEKDRATDEELVDLYRKVYETHGGLTIDVSHDDCRRAAVAAVAARVRQGRCLVAQAVGRGVDVHVTEFVPTQWRVVVVDREATSKTAPCSAAEVPATLARLLGEVSRG